MQKPLPLICLLLAACFTLYSCNQAAKEMAATSAEQLAEVDSLMISLAGSAQKYLVPFDKESEVRGQKGTLIHLDPAVLETSDGTPIAKQIEVQLIEMTDKASLLLQNAQTVSDGRLLVSGGAYYLNMLSDGKALQVKKGKALQVEFPKLSRESMSLFTGERDSLGHMNWKTSDVVFTEKQPLPGAGQRVEKKYIKRSYDELDAIMRYVEGDSTATPSTKEEVSEEEYKAHSNREAEREAQQKIYEAQQKTYKAIDVLRFGWINCDYFWEGDSEQTDIALKVGDDSIQAARFFAVFKDIKSILEADYWKGSKPVFSNVPVGREIHVIGLAFKGRQPHIFEQTIKSGKNKQVLAHFRPATSEEIKKRIAAVN